MLNIRALLATIAVCGCPLLRAEAPDAHQIVRKAVELSRQTEHLGRQYSMIQENIKREIGENGKVRKITRETYEMHALGGEPVQKLIRRDGQPLPDDEARKVEEKFREAMRERETEHPARRERRIEKYEDKIGKRRELLHEIPNAFLFEIAGDAVVDGQQAWHIRATPRPGFQPTSARTVFLTRMVGEFWISKQFNRLLKVVATTTGPVSFGWFLARFGPGTSFTIEQMRLNDGTWVIRRFKIAYDVKIALIKQARGETEQVMWNFRKPETAAWLE